MSVPSPKDRPSQAFSVLLLNPVPAGAGRADILRSQLSLGSLASALASASFPPALAWALGRPAPERPFEVRVLNLARNIPAEEMTRLLSGAFCQAQGPDLLCATATAADLGWARRAARAAAKLWPGAFRLIGGPQASTAPEDLLGPRLYQAACLGEGVETLTELALVLSADPKADISALPGLARPNDNDGQDGLVRHPDRTPLLDLEAYPRPSDSLDLFLDPTQPPSPDETAYVLAGLGCPHNCAFCAQRAIHSGRVRQRGAESIFEEIRALAERGYARFALVQETFLADRARVERFIGLMSAWGPGRPAWTVEARADQLDRPLLTRLKKAGLALIQLGLESGDQALLNRLGKGLDLERTGHIIDICRQLELDTALYLLVGLPGQDWLSVLHTARFLRDHPPFNRATGHASTAIVLPYPGTRLAARGGVKVLARPGRDWPARAPRAGVDSKGRFRLEEITETEAMTAREISEAHLFVDDLAQFQLAAEPGSGLSPAERTKAKDYARRMYGLIVHRALRELVVSSMAGDRRAALVRLIDRHGAEDEIPALTKPGLGLSDPVLTGFVLSEPDLRSLKDLDRLNPLDRLSLFQSLADEWSRTRLHSLAAQGGDR